MIDDQTIVHVADQLRGELNAVVVVLLVGRVTDSRLMTVCSVEPGQTRLLKTLARGLRNLADIVEDAEAPADGGREVYEVSLRDH